MHFIISIVLLWALTTSNARASDGNLGNITEVNYLAETLDGEARACGWEKNKVLDAVKLPIRAYTKIQEYHEWKSTMPVIYVTGIAAKHASTCYFFIEVQVYQMTTIKLPQSIYAGRHEIQLWKAGMILSGNEVQLLQAVERLGKKLATAWQNVNAASASIK